MSSDTVQKIKERLGIAEVVGSYLKLQKAGSNLKAKCPFHQEKTPSFFVSPERGSYYCFGCGAKGDIFTFVEEMEGVDFKGALRLLAERAGVSLVFENPRFADKNDRLFAALEAAAFYFEKQLEVNQGPVAYLEKRGIDKLTAANWRLGFAPPGWRLLTDYLKNQGFNESTLIDAGLIKSGERGFYDRFRSRLMFPIFDNAGRVIGFSGRIWEESSKKEKEEAKYLNSPETSVFSKSKILYGFNQAKSFIKQKGCVVLVEGQIDLVMAHKIGLVNTVATSGTALTIDHVQLIKRFANKLILAFDPDKAGFRAAIRASALALAAGMEVYVASLPVSQDPADLAKHHPASLKKIVDEATEIVDYLIKKIAAAGLKDYRLAAALKNHLLPFVARKENAITRSTDVRKIAEALGVREEAIWEELGKIIQNSRINSSNFVDNQKIDDSPNKKTIKDNRRDFLERRVAGLLYWEKEELTDSTETLGEVTEALVKFRGEKLITDLLQKYEESKEALIFEAEAYFPRTNPSRAKDLRDLVKEYKSEILKKEFTTAMGELEAAEKKGKKDLAKELLGKCQRISKMIAELGYQN
jgi:DNA primase